MKIFYSGVCDKGAKRKINQDSIWMSSNQDNTMNLFVVADGMGGHFKGEYASQAIVEGLGKWAEAFYPEDYDKKFKKMMISLQNKILEVNKQIYQNYNQSQVCGCTCVVLFRYEDTYGIISVGDSRIYKKRGWKVQLLTKDDVWENQAKIRDRFSLKEIKEHPNFGKLLCAVGTSEDISLSVQTDILKKGDSFLLCSDGLYKYCDEKRFVKILKRTNVDNINISVKKLLKAVYDEGAGDNISIILIRCDL